MWLEFSPAPELYFIPEQAFVQTCRVSLLGHIWPAPWTGALRLAGQIPTEKEGFLSFSRWQAAFGSLRDEAREGCWCYCDAVSAVIRENHLPRVSLHPSHCQDSDSGLDCLSHLVSVSAVFKSPPPICHPIVAHLFYHLSNLRHVSRSRMKVPTPALFTAGESTMPLLHRNPSSHSGPGSSSWAGDAQIREAGDLGLAPAAGQGTDLLRISVSLSANGRSHTCPTSPVSVEDQKIIMAARKH